ncbi:MAG: ATP-binding protein [Nocardioides sp.]
MPLNKPALALAPDPRSVQEARRWVGSTCHELGRDELVECAQLGVSELVTNALLHAEHPITVRVRGTLDHPRVEVTDGSPQPPQVTPLPATDLDDLLTTFGRGLSIVAMCSVAWGAAIEADGKCVWFEPAEAPHQDDYPLAEVFHADEDALPRRVADEVHEAGTGAGVELRDVPLRNIAEMRGHYRELRRELRLLSMAHQADYPLAGDLTEVFTRFEQSFPTTISRQIDTALTDGSRTVDVRLNLDPQVTPVIEQMLELLDLADEFCRAKRLLSLARSAQMREFQQWYFGEFIRQAHGEAPSMWPPSAPGAQHVS